MKKNIFRLFVLVLIATMAASAAYAHDRAQFNWSYKIKNGTIITKVPKRPQGQKDAIKLTVPKISTVPDRWGSSIISPAMTTRITP